MTGDVTLLVLLVNVVSTLLLVGLIWFVQVVHYPQFARVGADRLLYADLDHSLRHLLGNALPTGAIKQSTPSECHDQQQILVRR